MNYGTARSRTLRWGCVTLIVSVAFPALADSLSGKVYFEGGGAPVLKPVDLSGGGQCYAYHREPPADPAFIAAEDGAMKNVLIYIAEGLPEESNTASLPPVILNQEECFFKPHVLGIQTHQTLRVINSDLLLHNVNASPKNSNPFNVSMPFNKKEFEHVFTKSEFPIKVRCDVHAHMTAYVGVFDHPYFAVTNAEGLYEIDGLPPGKYTIEVWQELWAAKLGRISFEVTVAEGGGIHHDFEYTAGEQPVVRIRRVESH